MTLLRTLSLAVGAWSVLALTRVDPLSVRVTAPHQGLAARISGPKVTVLQGRVIRAGDGFVIVSTPADVAVDATSGDFFFRLEPDTAWVTVDVQAGAANLSASSYTVFVGYRGTGVVVTGVPPKEARSP